MIDIRSRLQGRNGLLLAVDLVCFLLFALLGLRSHDDGITLLGIIRVALPFQLGWLFVNLLMGKAGAAATDSRQVMRLWVPAWALGLIIRTIFFDRTFEATFAVVALLVNGVILLVWRSVLAPLIVRDPK